MTFEAKQEKASKDGFARQLWSDQFGCAYRDEGFIIHGSIWFGGIGSKSRMQQRANIEGHLVQVSVQEPTNGLRGFMSYPDWSTAMTCIQNIPQDRRHVAEIIQVDKICKPYLDFDSENPPADLDTFDKVIVRADAVLIKIFEIEYGIELFTDNILWLASPNQPKLSLHCVIDNGDVFKKNNDDYAGAKHLIHAIQKYDPELFDAVVDKKVYDRDRGMRMVGSSKYEKSYSVLIPYRVPESFNILDCIISNCSKNSRLIEVPLRVPDIIFNQSKKRSAPRSRIDHDLDINASQTVKRMLHLLQKVHPSAFHDPSHGAEDAYDRNVGVKFNYTDRSEPCFTGEIHSGTNNLALWIDSGENVWARCFSGKCEHKYKRVGELQGEERDDYLSHAVEINTQYLDPHSGPLKKVIDRWLKKAFKALDIKSITGSGKTTIIDYLMACPELKNATVLYVVHRQTLAFNITGRLHGFQNYLDITDGSLSDRAKCPRPVCQLDSIHKTAKNENFIPKFDLVILDESESLFHHFLASTLKAPVFTMDKLHGIIQKCDRVLTLDALWGAETYEMLNSFGISQQLIINEYRGPPRHYEFSHDWQGFVKEILQSIRSNRNIYIASMSTESLHKIKESVKTEFPNVDMLLHTSKTSDDLKRLLVDVEELWIGRAVGASPTIEAGVDFNKVHFDDMFGVSNLMSTTPMGFFQMLWRVRKLSNPVVRCFANCGIQLGFDGHRKITVDECLETLRFTSRKAQDLAHQMIDLPSGDSMLIPKMSPFLLSMAHNEARFLNGQGRFYYEFQDLAESQGHTVACKNIHESVATPKRDKSKPLTVNATILTDTPDISEAKFQSIDRRIKTCTASEDDKKKSYKHLYKKSWGIDIIDTAFVNQFGTNQSDPAIKSCIKYIFSDAVLRDFEHPNVEKMFVQHKIIDEVLKAMGWSHIFDVDRWVEADAAKDALMKLEFFRQYEKYIKVFSPRATIHKDWNIQHITESLNIVFASIGCTIRSQSKQKRVGATRKRLYEYAIDSRTAIKTASLVNLRIRSRQDSMCPLLSSYLQSAQFGEFSKYVLPELHCDQFLSDSDSE